MSNGTGGSKAPRKQVELEAREQEYHSIFESTSDGLIIGDLDGMGLAEMRTLLFALRPESLEAEGLVAGLEKQVAALTARHEIPIEMVLGPEPEVPLTVKEALYRIAQEALHNTFKHVEPSKVELQLECAEEEIVLEVRDDGKGFDTSASFPGASGTALDGGAGDTPWRHARGRESGGRGHTDSCSHPNEPGRVAPGADL